MDKIDQILQEARNSLSPFCIHTCKAKCCHKGKLLIEKPELIALVRCLPNALQRLDGAMDLTIEGGCPFLKENKCTIYNKRPQMCQDYPIFRRGNVIIFASSCTGEKERLLEEYKEQLAHLGCKILVQ
ncbi:MAG: YkgJ family cysteine cluster protein [Candidatus Woesearchaeota archaeon]